MCMPLGFIIVNVIISLLFTTYFFFIIKRPFDCLKLEKQVKRPLIIALLLLVFIAGLDFRSFYFIILVQLVIWNGVFDVIHLLVTIVRKFTSKPLSHKILHIAYRSSLVPAVIVACFSLYGMHNMTQLERTEYTVKTRLKNDYKFLFLSDMHFDTIQEKSVFENVIEDLNKEDFDFVILGGDICDEGTSAESAREVFQQISKINSRFGTYFVYGNHDRQLYSEKRSYSLEEFAAMIKDNNITILQDEAAFINDEICLAGREDSSLDFVTGLHTRKTVPEILELNRENKPFVLMADHQPIKAEFKSFADELNGAEGLQISGHTHAGQIFPFGQIMKLFGGYVYGLYEENAKNNIITLIVSSGVTGWGYPVRTEEKCEYVVVQLSVIRE